MLETPAPLQAQLDSMSDGFQGFGHLFLLHRRGEGPRQSM